MLQIPTNALSISDSLNGFKEVADMKYGVITFPIQNLVLKWVTFCSLLLRDLGLLSWVNFRCTEVDLLVCRIAQPEILN